MDLHLSPDISRRPRHGAEKPTIMLVAMGNSVHTVRWINMVRAIDARIVLTTVEVGPLSTDLKDFAFVRTADDLKRLPPGHIGVFDLTSIDRTHAWAQDAQFGYARVPPLHQMISTIMSTPHDVEQAMRRLKPDIVHSLEVQSAGYLTLEARRRIGGSAPTWILSNWGSDIYLYERLKDHRPIITELMRNMDGYMAECQRDIAIARSLGFLGQVFAPTPASGGTDFSTLPALADLAPPSRRNEILIKGYHGWAGRGLHILSAIHLAAPALRKYKIRVILAGEASAEMIQEIRRHDGLDIELSGYVDTHAEAMERLARARFVIGMGVSDGISTTLLEAMSLGVFPIQGDTSCACEWVRPGIDAFLLSPHDVRGLADAITRAATDDKLVNAAAITNRATVEQRWDVNRNARFARECYERMLDLHPVHGAGRGEA